jgi:2-polyprenyl-6-methoxyphenol hydroxylase-like FAD-dependent oxidoreductase
MAKLLIIGGGIGGLAAAACLHARGIEADVFERVAELREVGAALALWPNATRVLQRLGLLEGLVRRAHVPPAGALRDWRGRILKEMVQLQSETPAVFAHRAEVHRALLSAIPPERVHLNKRFTRLERNAGAEGSVRAVFEDGTRSPWADGLVGADGIRSVVREQILQDGAAVYRGYVAWRGVAEFDAGGEVVGESWGRGQRFGFIPLGGSPQRVGWWATANKPGGQGAATCNRSPAQWKQELLERFKGWHAPIGKLLEATEEGAILCNAIEDRVPAGRGAGAGAWGEGPLTLLGDAAHPTTPNLGQGACMAIEDGAVLAQAAAAIPDVATAFRVYERTRFARTARIVRESLKFGRIGQWENPVACWLRGMTVKMGREAGLRRQFQELWLYDAWDAPLMMPG